jgi:hypothetical protein
MRSTPSAKVTVSIHSLVVEQPSPALMQRVKKVSPTMASRTRRPVQKRMKRSVVRGRQRESTVDYVLSPLRCCELGNPPQRRVEWANVLSLDVTETSPRFF